MSKHIYLLMALLAFISTPLNAAEKNKAIDTRYSTDDEDLNRLKNQLYPEKKKSTKTTLAKPSQKKSNSQEGHSKEAIEAIAIMSTDELDKVKKNVIAGIRKKQSLSSAQKKQMIEETTRFYDALSGMMSNERRKLMTKIQ